ncbi:radical SAM protein (plasmid) [Rhizobium acidisoli]|uniref:Radical SAM protein n=1 Tax=Rhizobium acidisoli TaxID=1538158 RepID=A0AAE5TZQ6_9HYPH|nr:radical SAM protein [Rhizobium acidisoli]QAS80892.1 radical SAM protein [Rhizobium acidisoli]
MTVPLPSHLFVEVTSNCNLACPHCYIEAGDGRQRQLSYETVEAAIGEFKETGGVRFTLSGGEPTLHERWRDILSAALKAGLATEIITNGTRFLDKDLDFLTDNPIAIDISLEAANATTHDAIRGKGSFATTTETIERLLTRRLGHRITLCFSPMQHNCNELQAVFDWAERHAIKRVYISLLENRGRAKRQGDGFAPTVSQKQALIADLVTVMARPRTTEVEAPNLRFFPERLLGSVSVAEPIDRTLRMTPDGELFFTAYLDADPFRLGRYLPGNLAVAWSSDKVKSAFLACKSRVILMPECRQCWIYELCQGGSAMFAWNKAKGFFDVDSYCAPKRAYVEATLRSANHGVFTSQAVF